MTDRPTNQPDKSTDQPAIRRSHDNSRNWIEKKSERGPWHEREGRMEIKKGQREGRIEINKGQIGKF